MIETIYKNLFKALHKCLLVLLILFMFRQNERLRPRHMVVDKARYLFEIKRLGAKVYFVTDSGTFKVTTLRYVNDTFLIHYERHGRKESTRVARAVFYIEME
jgi:hypothetical protein